MGGTCFFPVAFWPCNTMMGCVDIDRNLVSDLDLPASSPCVLYVIFWGNKAWTVRYRPCLNGHSACQLDWKPAQCDGRLPVTAHATIARHGRGKQALPDQVRTRDSCDANRYTLPNVIVMWMKFVVFDWYEQATASE